MRVAEQLAYGNETMLVKFRNSRVVGNRVYAVGEVADLPDDVARRVIASKVASVTVAETPAESVEPQQQPADEPVPAESTAAADETPKAKKKK